MNLPHKNYLKLSGQKVHSCKTCSTDVASFMYMNGSGEDTNGNEYSGSNYYVEMILVM